MLLLEASIASKPFPGMTVLERQLAFLGLLLGQKRAAVAFSPLKWAMDTPETH